MFGKIIKIDGNDLYIKNELRKADSNLMGCHLIFEEEKRKVVGEITFIDEEYIKVMLVGEIIENIFSAGVTRKPSGSVPIRVINTEELTLILGGAASTKNNLLIGSSAIYHNFNVSMSLNDFFANHSAIIGNTGAGKSCGVARILQNLFSSVHKPVNAHIVLFDAYGEYKNTFNEISKDPKINVKKYTTHIEYQDEELLQFPVHFLEADDLAILLSLTSSGQLQVLEKALKLVGIFKDESPTALAYKNDIIAKCLLDVLSCGNTPSQMRDQCMAILSKYNTADLNLEAIIKQPGYNRTVRQCLRIDEQGKMNAISEILDFLKQFERMNFEDIPYSKGIVYTLDDLYSAVEFALISEGIMNSSSAYEKNNIIKNRLLNLINSEYASIFSSDNYITKEEYVRNFFTTITQEPVQIVNVNLSEVDDRFAKTLTKLYSKIFFKFTTSLTPRGTYSINIILEEAHRYVQNDTDINVIGYNIFDRITKEGRKYGTILTFITQRPSELSVTALSQCSNFLVFRMFHPKDIEIISNISANVNNETIEKLKTINPGSAMIFGVSLKLPILVKLELPNPMPESTSLNISNIWYEGEDI
ncbi:MAG: DUF87 domain-containing protein [Bacilli bacterium]|nr:DUF87 domain-containing protein [Bacilli bacterium]